MSKKHLTFERIVEISSGISSITEIEQIHIDNCHICKNRMESACYIENGIKESVKAEPIMDLGQIEFIADNVFDKCAQNSSRSFKNRMIFAVSGAVAASLLLFVFISGSYGTGKTKEILAQTEEISQPAVEEAAENIEDSYFPKGAFKVSKGEVISKERYTLTADTDAIIIHEYENYFSVKKGTVSFSVQSGTDFMVNLNNSVLVRVLGTVFTVSAGRSVNSVEVTEGLVEVIDLEKGVSSTVAKGGRELSGGLQKSGKQTADIIIPEPVEQQSEITDEIIENRPVVKKKNTNGIFNINSDMDLIKAEISDLENALEYSGSPVVQLQRLFELYRKTGHWGSIIHFWRIESSEINSRGNPFLKEMHFAACEASIRMFLYDNEVCRGYRSQYPDGPDPEGMEDHLKMAW